MLEPYNYGSKQRQNQNKATSVAVPQRQQRNNDNYQIQKIDDFWPSGGRSIEDIHNDFRQNHGQMMQRMNQMHSNIMKNFGIRDPFKDDPFFNNKGGLSIERSGFGMDIFKNAEKMMNKMQKEMNAGFQSDIGSSGLQKGHFIKQTFHQQGDDVYQTKAHGAFGDGNKIVDRKQMYENRQKGIQKEAHERMLNDKGRKVVKEMHGGQMRQYDQYKHIQQNDVQRFDEDWNNAAKRLGFKVITNQLDYGNEPYQNRNQDYGYQNQRGYGLQNRSEARGLGYVDQQNRGYFIPTQARGQDQPVRINRDIGPTQPSGVRPEIMPLQRGQQTISGQSSQNQAPRAINQYEVNNNGQQRQARQAAPPRGEPPRVNNYQQAPLRNQGPARAG